MMLKHLGVVFLLCGLALAMTGGPCSAPGRDVEDFKHRPLDWSPDGSELVFEYGAIYAVSTDGSSLKTVARKKGDFGVKLSPDISHDGSRLAYITYDQPSFMSHLRPVGNLVIEVSNIDGSSRRKLEGVSGRDSLSPAWSPDGSRIAFVSPSRGYGEECCHYLYSMAADGTDVRQELRFSLATIQPPGEWSPPRFLPVTTHPPAWSPDGKRLAFIGKEWQSENYRDIRYAAFTVASGGSALTRVGETWTRPVWSPDGGRLALLKTNEDRGLLYTVNPDGLDRIDVAQFRYGPYPSYVGQAVEWSPDGTRLLYSGNHTRHGDRSLVIAKADGSEFDRRPSPLTWRGYASWAPSGSRIAVYSPNDFIYTVAPDGSDQLVLVAPGEGGPILVAK